MQQKIEDFIEKLSQDNLIEGEYCIIIYKTINGGLYNNFSQKVVFKIYKDINNFKDKVYKDIEKTDAKFGIDVQCWKFD